MKLNKYQKQAIESVEGNWALLAKAGSGKTSVVTERIAHMINSGVEPKNILAVTFSRSAAENMLDRLGKILCKDNLPTINTCHSIGYSMLRQFCSSEFLNGLVSDYWIKTTLCNICVKKLYLFKNNDQVPYGKISNYITFQKLHLCGPDDELCYMNLEGDILSESDYVNIYKFYEKEKKVAKMLDFTDMLFKAYVLLRDNEDVRNYYQDKFKYVLVDEAQDCNMLQIELIKLINMENVMFIGDNFQCWKHDGIVSTSNGKKMIKDLKIGDLVETVFKRKIIYSSVTNIKHKESEVIKITTESGKILEVTPEHKCFSTQPIFEGKYIYVYIMYRRDKGYRVGIAKGGKTDSLKARINMERAERIWLVKQFTNLKDATHFENYLSLKYGVPTNPFESNGRGLSLDQEGLDKIFDIFGNNGKNVLDDFNLIFDYPIYSVEGRSIYRKRVNLLMNSGSGYDIYCESHGERERRYTKNYKEAYKIALQMKRDIPNVEIINERFSMGNRITLNVIPASQLMVGMKIPVVNNEIIELESIAEVEELNYKCEVYDIEVGDTGVLVVNNVVSHNSIYGFQFSSPQFILDFAKLFPNGKYLNLPINYRCSKNIVDYANKLIRNSDEASHESYTDSVAHKEEFKDPIYELYYDQYDESEQIANKILEFVESGEYDYKDLAILLRINAQSTIIQGIFTEKDIPFELIGGDNFFERKEIRDCLNFLKVVHSGDTEAFKKIYNTPNRYLGKVFLSGLETYSIKKGLSMVDSLRSYSRICDWRHMKSAENLNDIIRKGRLESKSGTVGDVLTKILHVSGYLDYLKNEYEDESRIENVNSLINQASKYNDIGIFLENIQKMLEHIANSKKDKKDGEANAVKILTVHKSKGLEFPVVFVISMNEGVFPHKRGDFSEERRLAYVAVTRAEKELFISSTTVYNKNDCEPSYFIHELFKK